MELINKGSEVDDVCQKVNLFKNLLRKEWLRVETQNMWDIEHIEMQKRG